MRLDLSTAALLLTGNPLYGDYNFNAYSTIIFANNTRNQAADVFVPNNDLVANCSNWTDEQWSNFTFVYNACGDLQTISDIEGVGVMTAFVFTCVTAFVACLVKGCCLILTVKEEGNLISRFRNKYLQLSSKFEWRARKANKILGKIILGLADQQMVTGFATIIAGWHIYPNTSAYNFYVVSHLAAFAILTQSIAFLVLFDVLHKSLFLHALRVSLYAATLFFFYFNAWFSYDLTGNEGYRAACPATCRFKASAATWVGIVAAGAPVYLFILLDLGRKALQRFKKSKKSKPHRLGVIFRIFRVIAWVTCIVDLYYSWATVNISSQLISYGGLIDSPTYDLDTWGFGQLVAMVLIVLPLIAAVQEWKDDQDEDRKREEGFDRLGQPLQREDRNIVLDGRLEDTDNHYYVSDSSTTNIIDTSKLTRQTSFESSYKGVHSTINGFSYTPTAPQDRQEPPPDRSQRWGFSDDVTSAPTLVRIKRPERARQTRYTPSFEN